MSIAVSPIQTPSHSTHSIADIDENDPNSKREDARNALSVFRVAFLNGTDQFDHFRTRLITQDLTDSSYENENGKFSVDLTYASGGHVNLELNIKRHNLEIHSPKVSSTNKQESELIKQVFLDQLEQTFEPKFARWIVNTVFSANITYLEWEKDENEGLYNFTITLDQKKSNILKRNHQPDDPYLLQSFIDNLAPNTELNVGRVVSGVIRPEQKTIIFSEGATLSANQAGAPSNMFSPTRMVYGAIHMLADRHIPASLKPGFNAWASSGYVEDLHMKATSFGFVQAPNQNKVSVGLISGTLQYGHQKHQLNDKWISPLIQSKSVVQSLSVLPK